MQGDEHLAVGQQCSRVTAPPRGETAGRGPGPRRRIIQLRADEIATTVIPTYDENLIVGQHGGCVTRSGAVFVPVACESASVAPWTAVVSMAGPRTQIRKS